MIRYGKIKNIGSGRVDIQITGSAGVTRNVRVSSQVNWNTLRLNDTVLVETIDGLPVVLHTIADTPLVYQTTERTYAGVGSNSGSAAVQNALLADGSVPLTGNMNVTPGVTIDGYDISVLGDTINNLQAADSIARTGYTVMSHASHLVETISSSATSILIRHGIFVDTESLSVSNPAGEIEVMKIVGAGVPTVDDNGIPCYRYTVQRRISTNPSGIVVGWAASTIVSGLTLRGYIAFDNRATREGTPSMRFVMHTNIAGNQTEHIARVGNLKGVLGYTDLDYGFAIGKLTSQTKFMAYNSTTDDLRLRGADLQLENESGELSFRLWGIPESGRSTGDISAGPQSSGHMEWMGAAKRLGIFSANKEIVYFDEIGGHFAGMITAGEELGPNIGIGVLDGEGTLVARNRDAMAQFILQTRSTGDRGVYMFAGNPKPEGGWLELDRTLTYDGTIRARAVQLLGGMAFGLEGMVGGAVPEIVIQDPRDIRRMGIIRPTYMGGYSVNGINSQYLSMLLSWGGATLEPIPGSGTWVEWKQGEAFWGDWNGNHFRVEKDGRIGHFFANTPKAWSDSSGNFSITGTITALSGSIGGWTINSNNLTSADASTVLNATGGIVLDALIARFDNAGIKWTHGGIEYLRIGTEVDEGIVTNEVIVSKSNLALRSDAGISLRPGSGYTILIGSFDTSMIGLEASSIPITGVTKLGDGGLSNYAQFAANGTLSMYGTAVISGYLPTTGAVAGATSQAQTFTNGIIGPSWKPASDSTTALQLKSAAGVSILNVDTTNKRIGINCTPNYELDVSGINTYVRVAGSSTANMAFLSGSQQFTMQANGEVWKIQDDIGGTVPLAIRWGRVSIGGNLSPATPLHVHFNDGATNTTETLATFARNSSGAAAALFGGAIALNLKSNTTNNQSAATVSWQWSDSTDASRSAFVTVATIYNGALANIAKFGGSTGNVFNGDATAWCDFRVAGDTASNLFFVDASADMVGFGTATPNTRAHIQQTSADTNVVRNLLKIDHQSTGTPLTGFGAGILFALKSDTTVEQNAGVLEALWSSPTHASRKGQLALSAYDATALRRGLTIGTDGSAAMVGLYSAAPVIQATTGGAAATFAANSGTTVNDASTFDGYTIKQIAKALRNLGALA